MASMKKNSADMCGWSTEEQVLAEFNFSILASSADGKIFPL